MGVGSFNTGSGAPPESGVHNTFLKDENGQLYAFMIENGVPCAVPTDVDVEPTETTYIDTKTGAGFIIGVENNLLFIQEV